MRQVPMNPLFSTTVIKEQGINMIEPECDVKIHVSVAAIERCTMTYEEQGVQSRYLSIVMRPLGNQAFENNCISLSIERICKIYSRKSIYY